MGVIHTHDMSCPRTFGFVKQCMYARDSASSKNFRIGHVVLPTDVENSSQATHVERLARASYTVYMFRTRTTGSRVYCIRLSALGYCSVAQRRRLLLIYCRLFLCLDIHRKKLCFTGRRSSWRRTALCHQSQPLGRSAILFVSAGKILLSF